MRLGLDERVDRELGDHHLELLQRHLVRQVPVPRGLVGLLALGAEVGTARFGTGAYGFWRLHVRSLLVEAGAPDADTLVDALLAPLAPELYRFQRDEQGRTPRQIADSLVWQAYRLLGPGSSRTRRRPPTSGRAARVTVGCRPVVPRRRLAGG